jgi:hypothetical protein
MDLDPLLSFMQLLVLFMILFMMNRFIFIFNQKLDNYSKKSRLVKPFTIGLILIICIIMPQITIQESRGKSTRNIHEPSENILWEESDFIAPESILIQDLDNDKAPEIIVGSHKDGVFVFNATGSLLWNYPIYSPIHDLFTHDIIGDSCKEIIFSTDYSQIVVLDCNGKLMWKYRGGGSDQSFANKILFEDINNDSQVEIICGGRFGGIIVFCNNGTIMWSKSGRSSSDIAIAKYNETEKVILVLEREGVTRMMSLLDGEMYEDWNQLAKDRMPEGSDIDGRLDDFNGDNFPDTILWERFDTSNPNYWIIDGRTREIILQGTQYYSILLVKLLEIDNDNQTTNYITIGWHNITAYSHSGIELWKIYNGIYPDVAVGDLNNDSYEDLVVSSKGAISGKNGTELWLNADNIDNKRCVNLGDIDSDNKLEVAVGTGGGIKGEVYLINGSTGKIIWSYKTKPVYPVRDIAFFEISSSQLILIARENDIQNARKGIITCINNRWGFNELYWEQNKLNGASRILIIPDVTEDNIEEILILTSNEWVFLLNGSSGEILWSIKFDEIIIPDTALLHDWVEDGKEEIIICSEQHMYVIEAASGAILVDWHEDSIFCLTISEGIGDSSIIIGQDKNIRVYNKAHELIWDTSLRGIPNVIKVLNDQFVLVGDKLDTSSDSNNPNLYSFSLDKGSSLWNQTNLGDNQILQIELLNYFYENEIFVRTDNSIVSLTADGKITMNIEYPRGVDFFTTCDFNGDSYTDVAVLSSLTTHKLQLFDSDSGEEFFFYYYIGSEKPTTLLCVDVNNDGFEDLIVGSFSTYGGELEQPTYTSIMIYYGHEIEFPTFSSSIPHRPSLDFSSMLIILCLIAIIIIPRRRK